MRLVKELVKEILEEEYQSHTFEPKVGDKVVNENPNCIHYGSVGIVTSVDNLPDDNGKTATYKCLNSGSKWKKGDELTKTLDQLVPAVSEGMAYHLDRKLPITENIYRPGSKSYFSLVKEARALYRRGLYKPTKIEEYYLAATDIGEWGIYEGEKVPLDWPMISEDTLREAEYKGKKVELGEPSRSSGPKKYQVYTKNKKGNVIKVPFGDAKGGLSAKFHDDDARKSFVARHNCEDKKDKTKPGYWSCRLPRYWKELGFKKNSYRFW